MKRFLFALMGIIISLPSWAASCDYVMEWNNVHTPHIVILFDNDKTDVKECAKTELKSLLNIYKDIKEILLIGSASKSGSHERNQNLSNTRVNNVSNVLGSIASKTRVRWSTGDAHAYYRDIDENWYSDRAVTVLLVQDHVSAICSNAKVTQAISEHPEELKKLDEACKAGLDNDKIIEILLRLGPSYGLGDIANAYKLYAELLKDTEDLRLDTSVWRTADGKFNTARLASDSIAGVVLGTVGGVVTSTIMKKSQIRNGLEYIKCVIGGQTVASYDDQFSVGLK